MTDKQFKISYQELHRNIRKVGEQSENPERAEALKRFDTEIDVSHKISIYEKDTRRTYRGNCPIGTVQ